MLAALSPQITKKLALVDRAAPSRSSDRTLAIDLPGVAEALPFGGLPRAAVVEIASPRGLARATSLALAACASAQAEARLRGGAKTAGAWCAWIDPASSLYAPSLARARVDRARLLVVAPPIDALARVAVRVAASRVFTVVVIDAAGLPGTMASSSADAKSEVELAVSYDRLPTTIRRLALAVESTDTTVLLLTDSLAHRSLPLPVAMRIELNQPSIDRLSLRVAKDRRGLVTSPTSIDLRARAASR